MRFVHIYSIKQLPDFYLAAEVEGETDNSSVPNGAELEDVDPNSFVEIDFDDGTFLCVIFHRLKTFIQPRVKMIRLTCS